MADREIALFENGVEYYRGKLSVNECYFRGRVFKDIQRSTGKGPTKFTISVSNGKKKGSDEWLASTFINCLAWQELGEQIASRYVDKDEIELIAKYRPHSYNKVTYPEFVVREVIRIKPENAAENPYPSGEKAAPETKEDKNGDFEEAPSNEDLPF